MDYNVLTMRLSINTEDEKEAEWARHVGIKAYNKVAHICNEWFIKFYNKIWDIFYPNEDMDKHPNYDRIYSTVCQIMLKPYILAYGGYKKGKHVHVNMLYDMKPENGVDVNEELRKGNPVTVYCDNMITIVRKKN